MAKRPISWNLDDSNSVNRLVRKAFTQMRAAHKDRDDLKLLEEMHQFLVLTLILRVLIKAFRHSPDQKIDGPRGVATQLGLTRNGVYCRLEMLDLNPKDFKDPMATPGKLIMKSPVLARLARRIMSLSDQKVLA
jgi:hypothetical protein